MKKTTKSKEPVYFVHIDEIEDLNDIDVAFGLAKQEAGLPISDEEFDAITSFIVKEVYASFAPMTVTVVDCSNCGIKVKKQPWYKRFWNWLRRK